MLPSIVEEMPVVRRGQLWAPDLVRVAGQHVGSTGGHPWLFALST